MSKSHILAEVLPCFLKCHKIYRYNILKCHFYCAIIHLKSFDGGNFMLYRKIESLIEEHLKSDSKKILLIDGARQIGKTYIINHVGKKLFENKVINRSTSCQFTSI